MKFFNTRVGLILALAIALLSLFGRANGQQYLITNVNLISMENDQIQSGMDVLIEKGMISKIGKGLKVSKGVVVIEGKDKYLLPGFFDMHTHFFYEQGDNVDTGELELKMMLANGITTVRITNGDPLYLEAKKNVGNGKWVGPEMIVTSPQFVGSWPWGGKIFGGIGKTPKQADSLVRLYKAQGYDQVKLTFMIKPDVYDAIQKAAREVGIPVVGHVGPLVKLPRALAASQQIEHLDEFIDMLLPDTSYNHGQSVSDMNLWRRRAWQTVPYLQENKIKPLVQQVKEAGIYVTPTNYFFYSFFAAGLNEQEEKARPSYAYIPASLKKVAWEVRDQYWSNPPPKESRDRYIEIRSKMITELWRAGVPLMAGSDSPQWFLVSGFALHQEVANLVQCGLSTYAALQAATINPAKFLGFDKRTGTVSVGKEADLILLEKNPLEDIQNTTTILGVMTQRQWIDRAKLDALLDEALALGK